MNGPHCLNVREEFVSGPVGNGHHKSGEKKKVSAAGPVFCSSILSLSLFLWAHFFFSCSLTADRTRVLDWDKTAVCKTDRFSRPQPRHTDWASARFGRAMQPLDNNPHIDQSRRKSAA